MQNKMEDKVEERQNSQIRHLWEVWWVWLTWMGSGQLQCDLWEVQTEDGIVGQLPQWREEADVDQVTAVGCLGFQLSVPSRGRGVLKHHASVEF